MITAQNGIPWWYFSKHGGLYQGRRLESVDPGGTIAEHLAQTAPLLDLWQGGQDRLYSRLFQS